MSINYLIIIVGFDSRYPCVSVFITFGYLLYKYYCDAYVTEYASEHERNKELKSRLYHIYADDEVKDDINRKADESDPLPDLLINAYYLLGLDWKETKQAWTDAGHIIPPVMITVANRIETSSVSTDCKLVLWASVEWWRAGLIFSRIGKNGWIHF